MKKAIVFAVMVTSLLASACTNNSAKVVTVGDSSLVTPPVKKTQDTTSITDTSYRIGDSVR